MPDNLSYNLHILGIFTKTFGTMQWHFYILTKYYYYWELNMKKKTYEYQWSIQECTSVEAERREKY